MEIQIILVGIELELLQGSPGRKYEEMAGLSVTWIVLDSLQVAGGKLDGSGQFRYSWRSTGQYRTAYRKLAVNWIVQDSLQVTGGKLDSSGQFCIWLEVNWIVQDSLQEAGCQLDSTGQFTGSWRSTIYSRRFIDSGRSTRELRTVYSYREAHWRVHDSLQVAGGQLDNTVQFTGSWRSTR